MKKRTVVIYPQKNTKENKYINNLYDTIKEKYEVTGYDEIKKSIKLFSCDVYHFNWIESAKGKFIKLKYAKKIFFITILKILRKKIIWSVHNNVPHEMSNSKETIKFMKFMAQKADKIHILCNHTIKNNIFDKYKEKLVFIPHGDYIENYKKSEVNIYKRYNINSDKKIMLFIGQIKKYKNIELLIQAFIQSNIELNGYVLLICGQCIDEEYRKELIKMSNENIYFDFEFIKDEEMEAYLRSAEIIVAPYNKKSSLNSGSLWMAMSYKKTMLLPLIGCVKDVKDYNELLYVYDYNIENEHYNALLDTMLMIKEDVTKNQATLKEKGEKAYNYILNNQTWKLWKEKWIELYKF